MSTVRTASATTSPTEFLRVKDETYAHRRIGGGLRRPLLCLQHFTGTLDNWDPAVTDPLGDGREVILFDSAGVGRSTGKVPTTVGGMAAPVRPWPRCEMAITGRVAAKRATSGAMLSADV